MLIITILINYFKSYLQAYILLPQGQWDIEATLSNAKERWCYWCSRKVLLTEGEWRFVANLMFWKKLQEADS